MYPSLKVELHCQAYGVPEPHYTWVDWEGIDATEKETWVLDQISGTLTAFKLERQDAGEYTCIAENSAGRIEASARLDVIIKPHVQELYNKTIGIGAENLTLTCKASGGKSITCLGIEMCACARSYVPMESKFDLSSNC